MSGGVGMYVRAEWELFIQTIRNFQYINVSEKKQGVMPSASPLSTRE